MLSYYYRRIRPFLAAYFLTGLLTTAVLALESWVQVDWSVWAVLKTLMSGVFFLALEFAFFIVPFLAYLLFLPAKYHNTKWDKWITFVFFAVSLYLLLFKSVSEYFFWEEFTSRFNFIAVDYLVYTQEVIENIYQSYPLIKILSGAFVITAAVSLLFVNKLTAAGSKIPSWKSRAAGWGMGLYQMWRGEHFLSHTLCTLFAAWLMCLLLAAFMERMQKKYPAFFAFCGPK